MVALASTSLGLLINLIPKIKANIVLLLNPKQLSLTSDFDKIVSVIFKLMIGFTRSPKRTISQNCRNYDGQINATYIETQRIY